MTYEKITHIDLFSGIGGFALAADRVFGNVEHIFCDNEPFAQEVLKKHWPTAKIYGDIRTLTYASCQQTDSTKSGRLHTESGLRDSDSIATDSRSKEQRGISGSKRKAISEIGEVYILTGGFPCQPFSQAGRRRGEEDDRFLWPEMLRVIQEFSPLWVIAENVRGLLTQGGGVVFERVCTDLEAAGYEVQPIIIPAVAVGAPHRRDRVWFIAHLNTDNGRPHEYVPVGKSKSTGVEAKTKRTNSDAPNSNDAGSGASTSKALAHGSQDSEERKHSQSRSDGQGGNAADTRRGNGNARSEGIRPEGIQRKPENSERSGNRDEWRKNWLEVATRLCGIFNGLSSGLDKTMSDGIYLGHAKTLDSITGQDLPCLWNLIQSEAFQWSAGRFNTLQNKDYLFSILWQHAHRADGQDDLPFESAEVQEAYVRNVWRNGESGCPPQGWRYNKQYAEEHKDSLSSLSHEVALVAKEVWETYLKDRNPRLKALGNAIVPQVAEEIMRAIKNV